MITDMLTERLEKLGLKMTLVHKELGYELRSADPIPFDAEYTRDLGFAAVKFLGTEQATRFGAIISFVGGKMTPLPFEELINPQTRRMKVRKVNVDSESYECARHYMIRLGRVDFSNARQLASLAGAVSLTPEKFRERFGYVAGLEPVSEVGQPDPQTVGV